MTATKFLCVCVCVCVCECVSVCMCMRMHTCVCTHVYVLAHVCENDYVCIHVHTCVCMRTCACTHVCTCVCTRTHVCVCVPGPVCWWSSKPRWNCDYGRWEGCNSVSVTTSSHAGFVRKRHSNSWSSHLLKYFTYISALNVSKSVM